MSGAAARAHSFVPSPREAEEVLANGTLDVAGRLADASNTTLFGTVTLDGVAMECVYKPVAGERPLWDFPGGTLAGREVAAYLVSQATGWDVVPPTVLRTGPYGGGSCQLWVHEDATSALVDVVPAGTTPRGWLEVLDALGAAGERVTLVHADDPRLRRMAVFDVVVNNADRKGGHVLVEPAGADTDDARVRGCDHGVCFHPDDKLRTVLWGWAGQRVADEEADVLARLVDALDGDLGGRLAGHLAVAEVARTRRRAQRLLATRCMPRPGEGWPAIPWPPF